MCANKVVSTKIAEEVLSNRLIGSNINHFTYFITGWTLRLIGSSGPEYTLRATDIQLKDYKFWLSSFSKLPINLTDSNEPDDVITGAAILSVTNSWPIRSVKLNELADLFIRFENDVEIIVKARVAYVDWTWQIDTEDGTNIIFCDNGELTTGLSF